MSLSLILIADKTFIAPLSSWCIDDIETRRLVEPISVDRVFGASSLVGTERIEDVAELRVAVKKVRALTTKNAGGFKVRFFWPESSPPILADGSSISGLLIDGDYYGVFCQQNYWTLSKTNFIDMQTATQRFDEAEITSSNMGTVSVVRRKGKSPLDRLLSKIDKFLAQQLCSSVKIVIS